MSAPVVFFDIAGPDHGALKTFYSLVFGWQIDQDGKFSVAVISPLNATVRNDPSETRIYIGVPDVTATLEQIVANGGTVEVPRFEVPAVVVLGLFRDPAGNPLGLVEMDGSEVRVPAVCGPVS